MALHTQLPKLPYAVLLPDYRWFPAAEELREKSYDKLLPPLVAKVRNEVKAWRDAGYAGATDTSRALLRWWFDTEHLDFREAYECYFLLNSRISKPANRSSK